MQGKNIKSVIRRKLEDWANSIGDSDIKHIILNRTIVTGGAIVSLLQNEDPKDFDIYFKDSFSLKKVAKYYVEQYIQQAKEEDRLGVIPDIQECIWESDKWKVLTQSQIDNMAEAEKEEIRVRVFIKSQGAVGEIYDEDSDFKEACKLLNQSIKENDKKKEKVSYHPVYLTNNAITLSDKIQLVLRFYGEPEAIHRNYDFIHCTCYYTSWDRNLVLPGRALEAIINKELYYVGSKYPLCSIIRTRKFINRGWSINAGQYVKMVIQLNDLNLKNLHIFEEQLIGVDSAYFEQLIKMVKKVKNEDPAWNPDGTYLINLVNQVFD